MIVFTGTNWSAFLFCIISVNLNHIFKDDQLLAPTQTCTVSILFFCIFLFVLYHDSYLFYALAYVASRNVFLFISYKREHIYIPENIHTCFYVLLKTTHKSSDCLMTSQHRVTRLMHSDFAIHNQSSALFLNVALTQDRDYFFERLSSFLPPLIKSMCFLLVLFGIKSIVNEV